MMYKRIISLMVPLLILITITVLAFERKSRLYALNELNVNKNKAILLRTNKCKGCYLAYAKLSGADLAYADLRNANLIGTTFIKATLVGADLSGAKISGANFSGAQWVDGSVCLSGSIGRCIRPAQ